MKFVLETGSRILIHSYDVGTVSISGINPDHPDLGSGVIDEWDVENHLGIFRKSITLRTNGLIKEWSPQTNADFNPQHFLTFTEDRPEIVLLGTGKSLRFPPADCLSVIQQHNLGYEVMDTAAACRTFNVLAAEDRDVILALLMIESI